MNSEDSNMPETEMIERKKPVWVGLALAPLAAPVLFIVLGLLLGKDNTPKAEFSGLKSWPFWAAMFVGVALVSYVATLTLAIPVASSLRRIGQFSFWPLVSTSALLGSLILASCSYALFWDEKHVWTAVHWLAAYGVVLGTGVGCAFCWFVGITSCSTRSRAKTHAPG